MRSDLPQEEIHLLPNYPLRLNKASGLGVACTSGTIWITIAGEPRDIFLAAGERHILGSDRLALVEAVGSGSIRLHLAPGRSPGLIDRILDCRRRLKAFGRLNSGDGI